MKIAVDCYSASPVEKFTLMNAMRDRFGLKYIVKNKIIGINATGGKKKYYSLNKKAEIFDYKPKFTSIKSVEIEFEIALKYKLV